MLSVMDTVLQGLRVEISDLSLYDSGECYGVVVEDGVVAEREERVLLKETLPRCHCGAGGVVVHQETFEFQMAVELLFGEVMKEIIPQLVGGGRKRLSCFVDEVGISENYRFIGMLTEKVDNRRCLLREPYIVLIAEEDDLALAEVNCLLEIGADAHVCVVSVNTDADG